MGKYRVSPHDAAVARAPAGKLGDLAFAAAPGLALLPGNLGAQGRTHPTVFTARIGQGGATAPASAKSAARQHIAIQGNRSHVLPLTRRQFVAILASPARLRPSPRAFCNCRGE